MLLEHKTMEHFHHETHSEEEEETKRMWIFGYGSILWRPGFEFESLEFGYIRGHSRRFWQGNATHRGTRENPGRVATLVEDNMGVVWGGAFEVVGRDQIQTALDHLGVRECLLGGYSFRTLEFTSRTNSKVRFPVLAFYATPDNSQYLGPTSVQEMTEQIAGCKGHKGHNVEYVTRLADFVRNNIPEDKDSHLFELDESLRKHLQLTGVLLDSLLSSEIR